MSEIKYGTTDLIPISQIVARTKVRLDLGNITDYDDKIELFINEAAFSIDTKPVFRKKNCTIDIVDGKACLPKNFKKFHGIRLCFEAPADLGSDNNPNPMNLYYANTDLIYLEQTFYQQCCSSDPSAANNNQIKPLQGVTEIIGNEIRFPIPCPFTKGILSYDGYATNSCDDGILELHPQYERGLSEYARAMMLDTNNSLWKGDPRMLPKTISDSMMTWTAQRMKLVSDAFAESFNNNQYRVKRILTGLMQNQNIATIN